MQTKPKSSEDRETLRASIIDAARSLFVERGIEAVSMREIARKINYSATTLYHHFADKDALLQAVCDEDFLALAESMRKIMQISDHVARIRAFSEKYSEFALRFPNHYRLLFMTPRAACNLDLTRIEKDNTEHDAYAQLKLVVKAGFDAGLFKAELTDINLIAQTLWASIHGVCSLQIALGNETWVEWRAVQTRLTVMQDAILQGLLCQSLASAKVTP